MTTSLAAQLRRLVVPSTNVLQDTKKRPSLLFNPKEAASISGDVVFEIGQEGFQQLIAKDENFKQYENNLFHSSSKDFDRNVQSHEGNKKIDKAVRKFLVMVSPYVLTNGAHKSLEWLLFRYRINEFNRTDLILAVLPYYTSNIFVRIVQLCKFEESTDPFYFLNSNKKFNLNLDRSTLFQQVHSNTKLVKCLIKFLTNLMKVHNIQILTVHFNFYCTTFCGAIETCKEVQDAFVTELMPMLLSGLSTKIADFASATYIIIARLLSKATISDKLLNVFVERLSELKCRPTKLEATLLLILIYQLQNQYKKLPHGVLERFMNGGWLSECLQYLHANGNCVYTFLRVLMQEVLRKGVCEKQSSARDFFEQVVNGMEFDMAYLCNLLSLSLDTLNDEALEDVEVKSWIIKVMNKLQTQHPSFFQDALQKVSREDNKHRQRIISALKLVPPKSRTKSIKIIWNNIDYNKPDFKEGLCQLLEKLLKVSNSILLNGSKCNEFEKDLKSIPKLITKLEEDYSNECQYYRSIIAPLSVNEGQSIIDNIDNVLNICASEVFSEDVVKKLLILAKRTLSLCKTYKLEKLPTFINLMMLLSHSNSEVKQVIMEIISYLLEKRNETLIDWFLKKFLNYKEEILADGDQVVQVFSNLISAAKNEYKEQSIVMMFVDTACSPNSSLWIVNAVLRFISEVNNRDIVEKLCKYFLDFFTDKPEINDIETKVVINLTNTFNQSVAPFVTLNSYIYRFFKLMLQKGFVVKVNEEETSSLRTLIFRQFSKETYMLITEEVISNLLEVICDLAVSSEDPEFLALSAKIFKHIDLNAKLISHILIGMSGIQSNKSASTKSKRIFVPTVDLLDTPTWKRGVCLLELIQGKKKIRNAQLLLPVLFDIMKKCLDFEEQAVVEYPKQLCLALILLICNKLEEEYISEKDINIELVIQCIRASQNPQTHYHALLVLTHAAKIVPSDVLQHVMTVFTFVGSTLVRHDDAYSFEIISKIVNTVIPILVNENKTTTITEILRVFVDALLDVPEHRRISLYSQLLKHVNAKENFHLFLVFVLEAEIFQTTRDKKKTEKGSPSKRIDFVLEICNEFSVDVILHTCCLMTKYLNDLPDEKGDIHSDTSRRYLINLSNYTAKQFRHFKYLIITFLTMSLSSKPLVFKMCAEKESVHIESLYKELIINVLSYIQRIQRICDTSANGPQSVYWKTVLYHSYDLLDRVNDMLSSSMFLLVIKALLVHSMVTVKKRALELLNTKLQNDSSALKNEELYVLLQPILLIIAPVAQQEAIPSDQETLVQTALLSVKLIVRTLGSEKPEKFTQIIDFIGNILQSGKAQGNILASVILCLAELCVVLRGHALSSLTSFMPAFLSVLKKQKFQETSSLLLLSVVTATSKFLDSFATFLNPYLSKIICESSVLISKWSSSADDAKCQHLINRLNGIKKKIGLVIPVRILIPTIDECYDTLVAKRYHNAIVALLGILEEQLINLSSADATMNMSSLTNLFLKALEFRCNNMHSIEVVNLVEDQVVNTLTVFIIKLSESTFRPLYMKFFDWGVRSGSSKERLITFYHLSKNIGLALKGLFVLFAGVILNNIADILRSIGDSSDPDQEKSSLLLEFVLQTLKVIFTYDSKHLINRDRFKLLMQPLVDLLEKDIDGMTSLTKRNEQLITPTLVQFALAVADDGLWKDMNYQILLKMRNTNPEIRLMALHCLAELVSKLKEDFMPLLPETIPFLAELLEDEDERVERSCQNAIREMEKVLGEPLQKYF